MKDYNNCYGMPNKQTMEKEKLKTKSINVTSFRIQESVKNKNCLVLIAKTEDGKEFVVGGNHHHPTYLEPLETSWDNMV